MVARRTPQAKPAEAVKEEAPKGRVRPVAPKIAPVASKKDERVRLTVTTPPCTCLFCHLDEPDAYDAKSTPQYKLTLVFPKEPGVDADASEEEITDFIAKVDDAYALVAAKYKKLWENPIKDGDDKENEKSHGTWMLTPHTSNPIPVVDGMKKLIDPALPYGGDLVRAVIDFTEVPPGKQGAKASFTPYLSLVQLLEKRVRGADAAMAMITEWEGRDLSHYREDIAEGDEGKEGEAPEGSGDGDY